MLGPVQIAESDGLVHVSWVGAVSTEDFDRSLDLVEDESERVFGSAGVADQVKERDSPSMAFGVRVGQGDGEGVLPSR